MRLLAASEDLIRTILVSLIALLALVTAGCGGSSSAVSPHRGIYRSQFTRGTGTPSLIVATVKADGTADITISDSTGLAFSGTATPTGADTLDGTLTGPGGSLEFQGTFLSSGRLNNGSPLEALLLGIGGAVAQVLMDAVQNNDINFGASTPFTGPLTVTTTGEDLGTASIVVSSSGSISGTATTQTAGTFPVTGSVTSLGAISFHGTGTLGASPVQFLYTGTLYQKPTVAVDIAGKGTYQVDASPWGDWTAD